MSRINISCKCTRCRNQHMEADRVQKLRPSSGSIPMFDLVCPRCGCTSFYDMSPQVAWCWASGLIEIGDALPGNKTDGSGALQFASGPKYALKSQVEVMARHGRGAGSGTLLVPGVPEAADQGKAMDALSEWLTHCNRGKARDGVVFKKGGF
ncbi:MAG: hypothetical protein A3I16_09845 [Burkholderiales bacterium RIFCSPLOWO2_02_FULL_66_35]|nr:MAG: hypothetical protein A3I16_09845 [Burkholderiales bacterium RIFCSPLOWO2_02_FULL_66_35]